MITLLSSMENSGYPTLSNLGSGPGRDTDRQSPATPFVGAGISLLFALLPLHSDAAECRAMGTAAPYHAASSQAERVLDRLIKLDDVDDNMFLFEVKRPDRELRKDVIYRGLFTHSLEQAWAAREAELLRKDCDGKYQDGEICGMNFSPLTCAQDYSEEGYLYRTECLDETSATITMRWPWIDRPVAAYRLLKQGKRWVLDGVACLPDGPAFNTPVPAETARQ